jgi:hypothetical protein
MAIETICQGCARKLRVDDEFAGRKARCPHCKEVYTVPQSIGDSEVDPSQPASDGEHWRLRTEDGSVYGPVHKADIDVWFTEGRITAASQLQRDGSHGWVAASEVYPALAKASVQPISSKSNPFADNAPASSNPYVAPASAAQVTRPRYHRPHRGGTILTYGIVGIACCIILAPVAWAMGQADLQQIRDGRMDPAGRGLTQAGMVLGIIGSIILAIQIVFGVLGIFFG